MKRVVKALLGSVGLLKAGRVAYSFVKALSPSALVMELRVRIAGGVRGIPVPPERLIFYVIGYRWAKVFLESGQIIVNRMVSQLERSGCRIEDRTSILDFGCGCGRLIRHLPLLTTAKLFGCDYNSELITWSAKNLSFAKFRKNELEPPLPYADRSFDLIYARSVFTHLSEPLQRRWMAELCRVLKPGGWLYFTTHGEQFLSQLSVEERERVRHGQMVVREQGAEGHNICTSFALDGYVRQHLADGFAVIAYLPGERSTHSRQDAYIFQKQ